MLDRLLDTYDRLLSGYAVPFALVDAAEDWHLTLLVRPSFEPEVVFDVDRRGGKTLLYRTRLRPSLWAALMAAHQNKGAVSPIAVERACIGVPDTHPLVRLVAAEHLFRLSDTQAQGLDGTSYTLVHVYRGGERRLAGWEPRDEPRWARFLDALREAEQLLPEP